MSIVTTNYGTWAQLAGTLSIRVTVADFVHGGGDEWVARLHRTGAFDRIVDQFTNKINEVLPDNITLIGDEFYGLFDCPTEIRDSIRDFIDSVDLSRIVQDNDPDAE